MESYIRRLKELEELALSFDGVTKCYAIQAGRELRIMVDAENVSDEKQEHYLSIYLKRLKQICNTLVRSK